MTIQCAYCGEDTQKRVFCSEKCRRSLEKIARDGDTSIHKFKPLQDDTLTQCTVCGNGFPSFSNRKTCSKECSKRLMYRNKPHLKKLLIRQGVPLL